MDVNLWDLKLQLNFNVVLGGKKILKYFTLFIESLMHIFFSKRKPFHDTTFKGNIETKMCENVAKYVKTVKNWLKHLPYFEKNT